MYAFHRRMIMKIKATCITNQEVLEVYYQANRKFKKNHHTGFLGSLSYI